MGRGLGLGEARVSVKRARRLRRCMVIVMSYIFLDLGQIDFTQVRIREGTETIYFETEQRKTLKAPKGIEICTVRRAIGPSSGEQNYFLEV